MLRRRVWVAAQALVLAQAYRWSIDEAYSEDKLSFSEMYMYGTDRGPWPFDAGESFISVNLDGTIFGAVGESNLTAAAFTTRKELDLNAVNLCTGRRPRGVTHFEQYDFELRRTTSEEDGRGVMTLAPKVRMKYEVLASGLQYVVLQICEPLFDRIELHGSITFRNPYGFLPAMYFGFLPFEGVRAGAFVAFQFAYLGLLLWHRDKLLPLHLAILAVSLIATAEACVWFAAYLQLNLTGAPLCCPFADHVVPAMSLEMLRRTVSRTLLLVVSLGFGLVRPKLSCSEGLGVAAITLGYLGAGVLATVSKIQEANSLHGGAPGAVGLDAAVLFFDLVFLVWIYVALIHTTDALSASGQTHKLQMYTRLAYTIATFVALVSIFIVVTFLSKRGFFRWPWELYWAQTVPLEVLNLAVVAAVCIIWRPTARSKLLATMQQLSTSDDADHDDDEEFGGLEMAQIREQQDHEGPSEEVD